MRAVCFFALSVLAFAALGCNDGGVTPVDEEIHIPALVAFSGDAGATGGLNRAALEVAVEDANAELAREGKEIHLHYGDTQSSPQAAAVLMNTYLLQNRRIIIGPSTSNEVEGVKDMIGVSNSLLISPGSTSLALAGADDHIFRMTPNDSHMVAELVDLMWARGQRYLVLIHRSDSWGNSVAQEMEAQFTQKGGTVVASHSYWALRTSVISDILEEAEAEIEGAAGIQSASEVAVHLTSLSEGSLVFEVAADSAASLADYAWYGSDGFVQDQYIVDNAEIAGFAVQTNFTAPIFRAETADTYSGIVARIEDRAGVSAGTYALHNYDAMRVAARTLAQAGAAATYEELEAALLDVMEAYEGLSGEIELDEMGDRIGGSYDFYSIQEAGGVYRWVIVNEGS